MALGYSLLLSVSGSGRGLTAPVLTGEAAAGDPTQQESGSFLHSPSSAPRSSNQVSSGSRSPDTQESGFVRESESRIRFRPGVGVQEPRAESFVQVGKTGPRHGWQTYSVTVGLSDGKRADYSGYIGVNRPAPPTPKDDPEIRFHQVDDDTGSELAAGENWTALLGFQQVGLATLISARRYKKFREEKLQQEKNARLGFAPIQIAKGTGEVAQPGTTKKRGDDEDQATLADLVDWLETQ